MIVVGTLVMMAAMWLLERLGAPTWIVVVPWLAPTLGVVIWAIVGADPALATDDDDDAWVGYSVRWAFAGEGREGAAGTARPAPLRVIVAALIGAPICWAYLVFGLLALVGFE